MKPLFLNPPTFERSSTSLPLEPILHPKASGAGIVEGLPWGDVLE